MRERDFGISIFSAKKRFFDLLQGTVGQTQAHVGQTEAEYSDGCNSHTSDMQAGTTVAATLCNSELCDKVDKLLPLHVWEQLPRLHRSHFRTPLQSSAVKKKPCQKNSIPIGR